ncbi:MAG: phospholipid carrier-dependent glycosyltransferase [Cyanobacteria bacterium]|nr:phospholipid carrier-dependent glycosyltransferase [Cyanobacteriota bacterium]
MVFPWVSAVLGGLRRAVDRPIRGLGDDRGWLLGLTGLVAIADGLWLWRDRAVPSWDAAEYLTASLTYGELLLHGANWGDGAWWQALWQASPKVPPLTQIVTAPVLALLGAGIDGAIASNLLWHGLLMLATYGLGRGLFDRPTGRWGAAIAALAPGLWRLRLDYLTDFPLVAVVTIALLALTAWWGRVRGFWRWHRSEAAIAAVPQGSGGDFRRDRHRTTGVDWALAAGWGLGLGAGLLTKQTSLFFLAVPIAVAGWQCVAQRRWMALGQWVGAIALGLAVAGPWYGTNWLFVLSGGSRATLQSAALEGDPSLLSPDAWIYYARLLPEHLSWPLLIGPIAGGLYGYLRHLGKIAQGSSEQPKLIRNPAPWRWLGLLILGSYFCCSVLVNKDWRYILPYVPAVAIALARGLMAWGTSPFGTRFRWGAAAIAGLLFLLNTHLIAPPPIGTLASALAPGNPKHVNGTVWPHGEVIDAIAAASPHLQTNVGVLPSTPEINQHNLNYFGELKHFRQRTPTIYSRQVGTEPEFVQQDARSFDWFITKTGDRGSLRTQRRRTANGAITALIETGPDFEVYRTWPLPDGTELRLHRRRSPLLSATLQKDLNNLETPSPLPSLAIADLPNRARPGQPIPVTYRWTGPSEALAQGTVLLTWRRIGPNPATLPQGQRTDWIDDRAIARHWVRDRPDIPGPQILTVQERSATLPPPNLVPGVYQLEGVYLDGDGDDLKPLAIAAPVRLAITPDAPPLQKNPYELDWVTQLRLLALELPRGLPALDRIFAEVGRLNQYAPTQQYLVAAEDSLTARIELGDDRPSYRYGLALAQVLQRDAPGAIASFEALCDRDGQNPNLWAYLAFVNLYDFRAAEAAEAIDRAIALDPTVIEFHYLKAAAALLRGHLFTAIATLTHLPPPRSQESTTAIANTPKLR